MRTTGGTLWLWIGLLWLNGVATGMLAANAFRKDNDFRLLPIVMLLFSPMMYFVPVMRLKELITALPAVLLAALLLAAPAHADTLLWELIHVGQLNYGPADVPPPVRMTFSTSTGGNSQVSSLSDSFTTDDIGAVIHATGDTFAGMVDNLMSPVGSLMSTTANVSVPGVGMYVDEFWTKPDFVFPGGGNTAQFNTYVPRLGVGLSGYTITDITQTITDIHWERLPGGISLVHVGTATHTISIYGHVPEPSSLLLIGFLCCHVLVRRARR